MPSQTTPTVGMVVRKEWGGRIHTLRIVSLDPARFEVRRDLIGGGELLGTYASMTAAAQAVRGSDAAVNGWDFFGLRNPNRRTITRTRADGTTEEVEVKITGKCQHQGCYEPADCKHGFCGQHCTHGHHRQAYSIHQTPQNAKPHIGMELEVEYKDGRGLSRGVGIGNCHTDGSLGSYGAEYKLLAESTQAAAKASELVKQLWERRAQAARSCGLHVHIDTRGIGGDQIDRVFPWAYRTQEVWFNLMPPSRRDNHYVQRLADDTPTCSHYAWIHKTTYRTVEIRLHGSTLNPYKVAGWITAMVHLQRKMADATFQFPDTGDATADFWAVFNDCPAEGLEYLRSRQATGGRLRDHAFNSLEE